MLSLRLSVCSFARGASCAYFGSLSWEPRGLHFGGSGAPFWAHWAPLGLHFGGLGLAWASFLGLWGSFGAFGAPWGGPLAAQGAQGEIFPLFSPPFWDHFGYILELKTVENFDMIFD